MTFEAGNSLWKTRSTHGRNPAFESPEVLLDACCEYFEWVDKNPLWKTESKVVNQELVHDQIPLMRAMTIGGMCIFLDICQNTWVNYRNHENPDFLRVTGHVEEIIRDQKFSGASAGLLNANIIARDLGLKDASEVSGPSGGPIPIQEIVFKPVGNNER